MSGECEPRVSRRDVICGPGGSGNPEVGLQGETVGNVVNMNKSSCTVDLSEIGSCTFWSSNVRGLDCVSLTNAQDKYKHSMWTN